MSTQTRTGDLNIGFVNPVKPGKKNGSIKSKEGDFYLCPPAMLSQFAQGETCKIEFKEETGKDGTIWRTITKKIGGAATTPPGFQAPRQRTNPTDSKQIFVTALLKEFVATGKVETSKTAVVTAGNALKDAYEELFGTPAKQETEATLNDEIPDFR